MNYEVILMAIPGLFIISGLIWDASTKATKQKILEAKVKELGDLVKEDRKDFEAKLAAILTLLHKLDLKITGIGQK